MVQECELEALFGDDVSLFLGGTLALSAVVLGSIALVGLAEPIKCLLRQFLLQEHASSADDGIPEVVVGVLVQVAH